MNQEHNLQGNYGETKEIQQQICPGKRLLPASQRTDEKSPSFFDIIDTDVQLLAWNSYGEFEAGIVIDKGRNVKILLRVQGVFSVGEIGDEIRFHFAIRVTDFHDAANGLIAFVVTDVKRNRVEIVTEHVHVRQ